MLTTRSASKAGPMKLLMALVFSGSIVEAKIVSVKPQPSPTCAKVVQNLKACRPSVCTFSFTEEEIPKSLTLKILKAEKNLCNVSVLTSIPSANGNSEWTVTLDKVKKNNGATYLGLMRAGRPFSYTFDENSPSCCKQDPGFCRVTSGSETFLDVLNLTSALDHCPAAGEAPASSADAPTAAPAVAPAANSLAPAPFVPPPVPAAAQVVAPKETSAPTTPLMPSPVPSAPPTTLPLPPPLPSPPKR